jgi:hypothetical protein
MCHSDHGGLIPEASLPTAKLPNMSQFPENMPRFPENGCDESLKITEILASESQPETVGFGLNAGRRH